MSLIMLVLVYIGLEIRRALTSRPNLASLLEWALIVVVCVAGLLIELSPNLLTVMSVLALFFKF